MALGKSTPEELRQRENISRHARAVKIVLQGLHYIMGYLPDYPCQFEPVLKQNPITLTVKIYWAEADMDWASMPTVLRDRLEKVEKELARIGHPVGDTEIPEPIRDNRTG